MIDGVWMIAINNRDSSYKLNIYGGSFIYLIGWG